jgi:DNA-binding transcriptional MerR regulator
MLVITLLVVSAFTVLGLAASLQKLTPEDSFSAIKKTAEDTVRSDSAALKKPVFEYNEADKRLEYYFGGVRVNSFELQVDDPYLFAFDSEFRVALLRDLFQRKAARDQFWVSALNEAEGVVLEAIRDIHNTPNKANLKQKLDRRQEQFDEAFSRLHQSIQQFAQSKGYTAKRVGDRGLASDSFPVPIRKDPSNGTVRVLPWTKYVMCHDLKLCGNNWPWRELVAETENMIGEYFYEADWGSGRRNDGKFNVGSSAPITFRPRQ